jgi:putative chitinase
MINRTFFFEHVRATLYTGKLSVAQVAGLTHMLDTWGAKPDAKDDRWLAYALGTAHHETEKMAAAFDTDLTTDSKAADSALEASLAAQIMFQGMAEGTFTSRKPGHYFNGATADWVNARRIINGLDRADKIAQYARGFHAAISSTV